MDFPRVLYRGPAYGTDGCEVRKVADADALAAALASGWRRHPFDPEPTSAPDLRELGAAANAGYARLLAQQAADKAARKPKPKK